MHYVILYLGLCLVIGLFGMNRKLGFWAYFFGSLLLTPIIGLIMLLVSDVRHIEVDKANPRISEQERGAMDYAYRRAIDVYQDRIAELVRSGRVSQQYVDEQLAGMVRHLRQTLQFDADGRPSSPLDPILLALERLPRGATEPEGAPREPSAEAARAVEAEPQSPSGESPEEVAPEVEADAEPESAPGESPEEAAGEVQVDAESAGAPGESPMQEVAEPDGSPDDLGESATTVARD